MWQYNYDYLSHHGILGQKWGVRRFQNKDGSLTAAGKKRYDKITDKITGNMEQQTKSLYPKKIQKLQQQTESLYPKIQKLQDEFNSKTGNLVLDYSQKIYEKIDTKQIESAKTIDEIMDMYGEAMPYLKPQLALSKKMYAHERQKIKNDEDRKRYDEIILQTEKNSFKNSLLAFEGAKIANGRR